MKQKNIQKNFNQIKAMKYLSLKGIVVLAWSIIPMLFRFKLRKIETPVAKYPSILAEAA